MDKAEILRALQAGQISQETAQLQLQQLAATAPGGRRLRGRGRFATPASSRTESRQASPATVSQVAVDAVAESVAIASPTALPSAKPAPVATPTDAPLPTLVPKTLPVAIIGMSGRYPGAADLQQLWDNLAAGINSVTEVPTSRWSVDDYFDPQPGQPGKVYCKWLGALDDVDQFDPLFFNIAPTEAEVMDPQHRLFLQEGYRAFEDAGYGGRQLSNSHCGVYFGIMCNDYGLLLSQNQSLTASATANSFAIGAARIPYYLNLKGPAIPIDTACSSSLVAAHLACQALRHGEIDMALVGGATLFLAPEAYVGMCSAGMLSPTGQCHTLDNAADGFVPGDGVGAVVLKRLADAERDGDHIYGLILATGINQDGKTNGITAPSGKSQAQLERRIYQQYGIEVDSIDYVEMHGTGTKLGDPVELEALDSVFREGSERRHFCGLGSIKSNLGHTSAAAGVASLHKVMLSLQQQKLPPTLNFQTPNEHYSFAQSPFYVNDTLRPWPIQSGRKRRAAISSFGYSGTNAHLVVEEYTPPVLTGLALQRSVATAPQLLIWSARTREQLAQQLRRWQDFLSRSAELDLADIAYTLQVGRESLRVRLALWVSSLDEFAAQLVQLVAELESDNKLADLVHRYSSLAETQVKTDIPPNLGAEQMQESHWRNLAEYWVAGGKVDWSALYQQTSHSRRRLSLPTYAFARQRYWVPGSGDTSSSTNSLPGNSVAATARLHPLVQQNISDLSRQAYRSTFSGDEFFLADHCVQGQHLLPGVVYLEMARTALHLACPAPLAAGQVLTLWRAVWHRPFVVTDPRSLQIVLTPEADGDIVYQVLADDDLCLHQGRARWQAPTPVPAPLDVTALQSQCQLATLSGAQIYHHFQQLGIQFGPAHQAIEQLWVGEQQLLAKLSLPQAQWADAESYTWHPSLLDSALQAAAGFAMANPQAQAQAMLLFGVEQVDSWAALPADLWVHIQQQGAAASDAAVSDAAVSDAAVSDAAVSDAAVSGTAVIKLNVLLRDNQGRCVMQLQGASFRAMSGAVEATAAPAVERVAAPEANDDNHADIRKGADNLLPLMPVWDVCQPSFIEGGIGDDERVLVLAASSAQIEPLPSVLPAQSQRLTLSGQLSEEELKALLASNLDSSMDAPVHLLCLFPAPCSALEASSLSLTDSALIEAQQDGVKWLYRLVKTLLAMGYQQRSLTLTLVTEAALPSHPGALAPAIANATIHGLVGSLAKEMRRWSLRLVDIDDFSCAEVWPSLLRLPFDNNGDGWLYRRGQWLRQQLLPVTMPPADEQLGDLSMAGGQSEQGSTYRDGAVYVVVGGAGGIGEVWSESLLKQHRLQLVWLGRRPQDDNIQASIERLSQYGPAPCYIQADASDLASLQSAYQQIKQQFGAVHGLVHSAVGLFDKSIASMTEQHFAEALAVKVEVSVHLAQVFADEPIELALFFSSLAAFSKDSGKASYAAGCVFKDNYALQLQRLWPRAQVKVMNWGFWGSVGAASEVPEAFRKRLAKAGIGVLEADESMWALEQLIRMPVAQMALTKSAH